jgi:uncharacterized membrane protein YjjP (DUF1212 family)
MIWLWNSRATLGSGSLTEFVRQSTEETVTAAARLADVLGLRTKLLVSWGDVALEVDSAHGALVRLDGAEPTGVDMGRVASVMRVIDKVAAGHLNAEEAWAEIETASHAHPAPTWLFATAAAAAVALRVIFGVYHFASVALIAGSAGVGALLRRCLARLSKNVVLQPFCAALLAGAVGALAARYQLISSLRLVVCPCMILLPGPHILNGGLDLMRSRINLDASRILFALLVVGAIAAGLLCALTLLGANLPIEVAGRDAPLFAGRDCRRRCGRGLQHFLLDPLSMLPWPMTVGALAHALRWYVMAGLGFGPVGGALVACLTVGLVQTPVGHRWRMPFAPIGFASVVSMLPGAYLFPMASGLAQMTAGAGAPATLVSTTMYNGVVAAAVVLAMCPGLLVPRLVLGGLSERATRPAM